MIRRIKQQFYRAKYELEYWFDISETARLAVRHLKYDIKDALEERQFQILLDELKIYKGVFRK